RLGNGLGNQLFTYAAAYSFAKKYKAKLYVDDESGFYKMYKYELHNLNISAPIVEKKYKFLGIGGRIKRKILQKLQSQGLSSCAHRRNMDANFIFCRLCLSERTFCFLCRGELPKSLFEMLFSVRIYGGCHKQRGRFLYG
ncbi:hypothetical protein, partial [Mesonia mobilis]|uniref:hypothetical protein n=1 Tax=Mesonia mobilis TaxID=369791 RepID=UPI0026EE0165